MQVLLILVNKINGIYGSFIAFFTRWTVSGETARMAAICRILSGAARAAFFQIFRYTRVF